MQPADYKVAMVHPLIQNEIDDARRAFQRLEKAKTPRGAVRAWADFLASSNRAINKLKKYANRSGQGEKYRALMKEIWKIDLTTYMRNARNDHEHGLEMLAMPDPHGDRIALGDGSVSGHVVYGQTAQGEWFVSPQTGPTEIIEAGGGARIVSVRQPAVRMVPIRTERGETVFPPHVSLQSEDESEILAAGRVYLSWVIEKVRSFD